MKYRNLQASLHHSTASCTETVLLAESLKTCLVIDSLLISDQSKLVENLTCPHSLF